MSRKQRTPEQQEFAELITREIPPVIARKSVEQFLGGIVTMKTLANADAKGTGPDIAYAIGRTIVYRREALVDWLLDNFEVKKLQTMKGL